MSHISKRPAPIAMRASTASAEHSKAIAAAVDSAARARAAEVAGAYLSHLTSAASAAAAKGVR
ncbi:hypothetical protein ACIP5N_21595 [Streptomyces sp. NPDC088768]|uniref:hypothetical protein n=1 Tax=Streptomyces sp. NPDC088768 TaxID=3365894 RepID=UPI0038182F04